MTDNVLLSLRGSPKRDPDKDSLPFLISRINEQKGSFRNVTEESLEEEIVAGRDEQMDSIEESEEPEDVQDSGLSREQLVTAREEMLGRVMCVRLRS